MSTDLRENRGPDHAPRLERLFEIAAVEGSFELEVVEGAVPPHLSGAYAELNWQRGAFPLAEEIADTILSLPLGPHVTEAQAAHVVQVLSEVGAIAQ